MAGGGSAHEIGSKPPNQRSRANSAGLVQKFPPERLVSVCTEGKNGHFPPASGC